MTPATDDDSEGPLKIGQSFIGKYEIVAPLGRGGHAFVYEARHRFMGHHVAIKVLHRDEGVSQNMLRRGQAEAQIQKGLRHPNIVEIDDAGITDDGQLYIVMERLRGRLWRDALNEYGRFEVEEVLLLAALLADGLHAAHERGVIHRDLKPDNAFLTKGNGLKVLDFGVAKLAEAAAWATQKDMVLGTLYYMSPEQILATPITPRADIYALGIMMYEALVGEHPVQRLMGSNEPSMYSFTRIIAFEPMPPVDQVNPRVPRYVADLVNTATEKKVEWRFASMAEFATEIRECLANYREEAERRGIVLQTRDLSRAPKAISGLELKDSADGSHVATPAPPQSGGLDTEPASRPLFFGDVATDILAMQRQPATPPTPAPPASSERPTVWTRPGLAPGATPAPPSRPPPLSAPTATVSDVAIPGLSLRSAAERPPITPVPATPSPAPPPAPRVSMAPAAKGAKGAKGAKQAIDEEVFDEAMRRYAGLDEPRSPSAARPQRRHFTLQRAMIAGALVGFTTFGAAALYLQAAKPPRAAASGTPVTTKPPAETPPLPPPPPPLSAAPAPTAPAPAPAPVVPTAAQVTAGDPPVIGPALPRQIAPTAPRPASSHSSAQVASGLPFDDEEPAVKPAQPATKPKPKPADKMDERLRRLEQDLDKKNRPWVEK